MVVSFPQTQRYLEGLNISNADKLDQISWELINDEATYERASQALRRRFVRGATEVPGIDRNDRATKIKRERYGGKYKYYVQGANGTWSEPDERIWIVAMYALWQSSK